MDGHDLPSAREETTATGPLTAQVEVGHANPIAALAEQFGSQPLALVSLFVSPSADFTALVAQASDAFGDAEIVACTTAGELGTVGYMEDMIVALGFPSRDFAATVEPIDDVSAVKPAALSDRLVHARMTLSDQAAELPEAFAFLLIDGLSLREDEITAALATGLGPLPLFGGSAGDGTDFGQTLIGFNGTVFHNGAVVVILRTRLRVKVFSLDHLEPLETRMVVTDADPARRLVREINAEPAAQEYARILGKDPHSLDPFTFAAHPVVVRLGGRHHVRAIQRVTEDGALIFYSAVDEGMVLTLAESRSMVEHLDTSLEQLSADGPPLSIFACDCILRRIEARQSQITHEISRRLAAHKVVGFSTYGEQFGAMHVNQTMTGVAFYPPRVSASSSDDGARDVPQSLR